MAEKKEGKPERKPIEKRDKTESTEARPGDLGGSKKAGDSEGTGSTGPRKED